MRSYRNLTELGDLMIQGMCMGLDSIVNNLVCDFLTNLKDYLDKEDENSIKLARLAEELKSFEKEDNEIEVESQKAALYGAMNEVFQKLDNNLSELEIQEIFVNLKPFIEKMEKRIESLSKDNHENTIKCNDISGVNDKNKENYLSLKELAKEFEVIGVPYDVTDWFKMGLDKAYDEARRTNTEFSVSLIKFKKQYSVEMSKELEKRKMHARVFGGDGNRYANVLSFVKSETSQMGQIIAEVSHKKQVNLIETPTELRIFKEGHASAGVSYDGFSEADAAAIRMANTAKAIIEMGNKRSVELAEEVFVKNKNPDSIRRSKEVAQSRMTDILYKAMAENRGYGKAAGIDKQNIYNENLEKSVYDHTTKVMAYDISKAEMANNNQLKEFYVLNANDWIDSKNSDRLANEGQNSFLKIYKDEADGQVKMDIYYPQATGMEDRVETFAYKDNPTLFEETIHMNIHGTTPVIITDKKAEEIGFESRLFGTKISDKEALANIISEHKDGNINSEYFSLYAAQKDVITWALKNYVDPGVKSSLVNTAAEMAKNPDEMLERYKTGLTNNMEYEERTQAQQDHIDAIYAELKSDNFKGLKEALDQIQEVTENELREREPGTLERGYENGDTRFRFDDMEPDRLAEYKDAMESRVANTAYRDAVDTHEQRRSAFEETLNRFNHDRDVEFAD